MRTFTIENTEKNNAWVGTNLDFRDFTITSFGITIKYFNEMQKNDILKAIA